MDGNSGMSNASLIDTGGYPKDNRSRMSTVPRVLILAQTPPPTHGQSVMVGHLVTAALERRPDNFVHVNLRLSKNEQDVGRMRPAKLLLLAWCAVQALAACTLRGAKDVYYVPAPGKRGPIIRDVLLLSLLKPFTRRLLLHWHSVGLGGYLQRHPEDRWGQLLLKLLQGHALSLCLSESAAEDVRVFHPGKISIVPNGIPDPCPDFPSVLAARKERLECRQRALTDPSAPPTPVHLLYLGLCTRSKGIFEVLSTATALALSLNQDHPACPVILTIAGPFPGENGKIEFSAAIESALQSLPAPIRPLLTIHQPGFTGPEDKRKLLEAADLFIFPTRYENEGLPLTLLESMAFGLPILTTPWRAIPEALPANYPYLADYRDVENMAQLAREALLSESFPELREWFLQRFTLPAHLEAIFQQLEAGNL